MQVRELITKLKEMQMLHGGSVEVMYLTIHDDITDIKDVVKSDAPIVLLTEKAQPKPEPKHTEPDLSFIGL